MEKKQCSIKVQKNQVKVKTHGFIELETINEHE